MKKMSLLSCFLNLSIAFSINVYAQSQPMIYGNGMPIKAFEYTNVVGSPFLFDEWHAGSVAFNNGKLFDNLLLKYNIKDGEVYFKSPDDSPMAFKDGVTSFTLSDEKSKIHTFRKGFPNVSGITDQSYLEVLNSGKAQFLKKESKSIVDSKEYGSGNTDRRFIQSVKYYIYIGFENDLGKGNIVSVKRDQKTILNVLNDKEDKLIEFVQKNSLNFNNENDIIRVLNYYNKL